MRRNIEANKLPELVVARSTKGAAFNPPPCGYQEFMKQKREQINTEFQSFSLDQFISKYAIYLYDVSVK